MQYPITFTMNILPVMDRGENQKLVLHKNCVYSVYSRDKNHTDLFKKFQFL